MKPARLLPSPARTAAMGALVAAALAGVAPSAQARNVRVMQSVADTLRLSHAHDILGTLDLRFGSATGRVGGIVRRDVTVTGSGATRLHDVGQDDSVRPADQDLCARAFADAVTQLAFSARAAHATAIAGVVSAYEGKVFDDPDHFECHVGTLKAAVTLRAQLVRGPVDVPVISPPPDTMAPPPPAPMPPTPLPPVGDAPPPHATFQPVPPAPAPTPD